VLAAAGVARGARHVAFAARDEVTREARTFGFGSSIPLEKARRDEVLLAWAMNGRPLPPAHGFPLRAVVPGFIGARSVKWLDHITLALEPSSNYFQRRAYKLFPPHVRAESADWRAGMSLAEQFTNVVICTPRQRQAAAGATVHLAGYALGGDGRTVVRVEVSPDDGRTWQPAAVERGSSPWTWCFWEASLAVPAGATRLWARAWDDHEIQPAFAADLWNFKGYMNNSWYCLHLA
jgi:sulfite oxidase